MGCGRDTWGTPAGRRRDYFRWLAHQISLLTLLRKTPQSARVAPAIASASQARIRVRGKMLPGALKERMAKKNRQRRGDEGEGEHQDGQHGRAQRGVVKKHPAVYERGDFSLAASGFEAGGAEMLGAQMHVAERAEEAAAGIARDGGAFLRMVEAA